MTTFLQGFATILGRLMLATIFLMSALGNKIPKFNDVAAYMASEGVPQPKFMLAGAIVFLLAGGFSLVLGFKARIGAALLMIFLVLATYYFHDFWTFEGEAQVQQMIQFMKNLSLMGAMLLIVANGAGPASVDALLQHQNSKETQSETQN